jgi:NADH:ubiquinone oxidoreductase subunit 2 (subunit N)
MGLFTSIITVYYYIKIGKLLITKESEEMTAYIQTYVSSPLPSLSKSSIKVGLIVCVVVSTFWGVLMNPINTIIQNALISNHFISI